VLADVGVLVLVLGSLVPGSAGTTMSDRWGGASACEDMTAPAVKPATGSTTAAIRRVRHFVMSRTILPHDGLRVSPG
jgi:hypothetical protein